MDNNIGKIAKNAITDYSAAGAVAAYFALQTQISTMPDLPAWAVVVLMLAALVRGLALQLFDGRLTPDELAAGLVEATEDIDEARALLERKASEKHT